MGLKLLHFSDIHFIKNAKFDLDEDLRNEIERDLQSLLHQFVKIDAILVGGDVAYSAATEEYENAYNWLKSVCKIVDCSVENVLTIPGNHDVERGKICPMVESVHADFKRLRSRADIDHKLGQFLTRGASAGLLKPFDNYEAFAQRYGAVPERESPLYWEKDFQLNGAKLRIRGINSAFVSNKGDHEHTSKLMTGTHQTKLKREDGVIYCVLCHHPPEWLYDGEETEKDFLTRAKLHLYGHKHKIKVLQQGKSLKLAAGAMHPERQEQDWEPRYNILDLEIVFNNSKPFLQVKLWKRVWSADKTKFVPDFEEDGSEFCSFQLALEDGELEKAAHGEIKSIPKNDDEVQMKEVELIDPSAPSPRRKLLYMFASLPYHKKLRVAVNLELIRDEDSDKNEVQKTQAYFSRAEEYGLLHELWNQVMIENDDEDDQIPNPF
ncbi:MAG TPA: metallophosphoesterase [Bacteroidia bacterium]|jgi:hypothetical protein